MTVFPTAGHLCSARQAPQVSESAGKRKGKNATGRGNPYLGGALGEAAANAAAPARSWERNTGGWSSTCPRRKPRAPQQTQLVICYELLSDPQAEYKDLGTDYYERRANIRREVRSHARAIERRGYRVILEPIDPGLDPDILPVTKAS